MTTDMDRAGAGKRLAESVRWALDHAEHGVLALDGVVVLRSALAGYNEEIASAALSREPHPPAPAGVAKCGACGGKRDARRVVVTDHGHGMFMTDKCRATFHDEPTPAEREAAGVGGEEACCVSPLCPHPAPGGGPSQVGGATERDAGIVPQPGSTPDAGGVGEAKAAFYEAAARHFTLEFDCPVTEDGPPQEWYDDHDVAAREAGQALRRLREAEARAMAAKGGGETVPAGGETDVR